MLLPTKNIKLSESLIALGAFVLKFLDKPKNIDQVWAEIKQINNTSLNHSYDNFLLSLDFLFTIGIIDINKKGELILCK
jgi:hypothetical protein